MSVNAAVTISSATPTCCSAMKIAITTTAPLAIFATVGTPDTLPAEARIRPANELAHDHAENDDHDARRSASG